MIENWRVVTDATLDKLCAEATLEGWDKGFDEGWDAALEDGAEDELDAAYDEGYNEGYHAAMEHVIRLLIENNRRSVVTAMSPGLSGKSATGVIIDEFGA